MLEEEYTYFRSRIKEEDSSIQINCERAPSAIWGAYIESFEKYFSNVVWFKNNKPCSSKPDMEAICKESKKGFGLVDIYSVRGNENGLKITGDFLAHEQLLFYLATQEINSSNYQSLFNFVKELTINSPYEVKIIYLHNEEEYGVPGEIQIFSVVYGKFRRI